MCNTTWLYAGNSLKFRRVIGRTKETISREDSSIDENPQRLHAVPQYLILGEDIVRSPWRHGGCKIRYTVKTSRFLKYKFFRINFCKIYSTLGKEQPDKMYFILPERWEKESPCLINEVLTRTNGVMIWVLSQEGTRWKCIGGKDAVCPHQDEKTPWSFTTAWHWAGW